MARFDVFENLSGAGYLIDVQVDLLSLLNTRVVIPLLPVDMAPARADRLNPEFEIRGTRCSLVTQFTAAVPCGELKETVASLDLDARTIVDAIDFLHQGW